MLPFLRYCGWQCWLRVSSRPAARPRAGCRRTRTSWRLSTYVHVCTSNSNTDFQLFFLSCLLEGVEHNNIVKIKKITPCDAFISFSVYEHVKAEAGQHGVLELGVLVHDDGHDAHEGQEAARPANHVLAAQPILRIGNEVSTLRVMSG